MRHLLSHETKILRMCNPSVCGSDHVLSSLSIDQYNEHYQQNQKVLLTLAKIILGLRCNPEVVTY